MQVKKIGIFVLASVLIFSACSANPNTVQPVLDNLQAVASAAPQATMQVLSTQQEAGEAPAAAPQDQAAVAGEAPPAAVSAADPYYTDPGVEEVSVNEKTGRWLYRSNTLYVNVTRTFNKKKVQTYFVADIRFKPPEMERVGFASTKKPGRGSAALYKIARAYQAVIAVNGDFMQQGKSSKKGTIIRNGKIYNDIKKKSDHRAKTLAFHPDGVLRVHNTRVGLSKDLKTVGVKNTFSFGPVLINNGVVNKDLKKHRLNGNHPRCAVGMVEPYHYLFVLVDGRSSRYSKGMTLVDLASLFKGFGCPVAYALDGGQSATMSFMGKNINKYGGSTTGQRHVTDTLMFGFSKKVPKK